MLNGGGTRWSIRRPDRPALAALVAALVLVVVVLGFDRVRADRSLLLERPPDLGIVYLVRTVVIAAASVLGVLSVRRLTRSATVEEPVPATRSTVLATLAGAAISLGAASLVLADPARLTSLAEEDGPVEWLSAVFAFAAGAAIGAAALAHLRGERSDPRRRWAWLVLAIAGVSILIGFEEVSWFQRVLEIKSPTAVQGRNQAEFNLHNGATTLSENLYYVGGFVLLVAAPGLLAGLSLPGRWAGLAELAPGPIVLHGSVSAAALVYEMWEVVPIQMTFFASLAILLTDRQRVGSVRLGQPVALAMVVVVAVFLLAGQRMTRSWDDTEVRELLLAYGLLLYGVDLLLRQRRHRFRARTGAW